MSNGGTAYNTVRNQCWDEAIKTFGTGYIFEQRANKLRRRLRTLTFFGIGVPVLVGGLVLSFGTEFFLFPYIIVAAALVLVVQLIMSVWSLTARWEDTYAYAIGSDSANRLLSSRFRELGSNPPRSYTELKQRYDLLQVENNHRSELDYQQGITPKEYRIGMRAGLRQFQRPCATCTRVPTSMEPTDCDTCGNF